MSSQVLNRFLSGQRPTGLRERKGLACRNQFDFLVFLTVLFVVLTQSGCVGLASGGSSSSKSSPSPPISSPPSITIQPVSQTLTAGQTASFSATASGTAPLSYQWRKNGTAITGATAATYTTPATITSDSGSQFTVIVSNSEGNVTSNAATLAVIAPVAPLQITTGPLPNAQAGIQFQASLATTRGVQPYHWSVTSGTLPSGLSLNPDTGVLSGMALRGGTFDFTAQVTDSSSPKPLTAMKALTLSVLAFALRITSGGLPNGQVGVPFQASVSASGGVTPYTWVVSGALPSGVGLNAASGTITGTPTQAGTSPFAIQLTDSTQQTSQMSLSITIAPAGAQPQPTSSITVSPSKVAFASVNVGDSISQTETVSNTGNSAAVINQATVTGSGFSTSGLTLPLTLAAGAKISFNIQFVSAVAGGATGNLLLTGSMANSPSSIALSAYGTQTPLSISNVVINSLAASSSGISWNTNLPADSQIEYGTIAANSNFSLRDSSLVTSHSVTLNSLSAGTLYHFQVESRDPVGEDVLSPESSFTTTASTGTTYYVDAINGNDVSAGTSPANAWKTIAKVNASTFIPGDQILFKRGELWREQLTVPSSGAAGNYIVFDAYGSGAKPIFNAADLIVNWTNAGGSVWSTPVSLSPNQVLRNQARMVKKTSRAALAADNQWFYDGSATLYVFSVINPNNATIEASHRNFAFWLNDKDHVGLNNIVLEYCNSTAGCYFANTTANRSGFSMSNVDIVYSYGPAVSFDNTKGAFDSVTLTNVTTDHCASFSSGSAALAFGILTNGSAFTNIEMIGGHIAYTGVHGDPSVATLADFGVWLDNVKGSQFIGGIYDHNGSSAWAVQNASNNITVSGGAMHDDGLAPVGDGNELDIGGLGAGSSNIVFTGIDLYGSRNSIIEIATTSTNAVMSGITITNCRIHGGLSYGLQVGGGHTGIVFKYNQVYGNAGYGLFTNEGGSGNPAVLVYGNVFWGNGTGGVNKDGVYINSSGIIFKNNVVAGSDGQEIVKATDYYKLTSDYNLFYHSAGGPFLTWSGVPYGLPDWQQKSGQDIHSIYADPQFLDASNADFRVGGSSPAIYKGATLGSTYNMALDPRTTFPYGTVDQDAVGPAWTIGAFAYF